MAAGETALVTDRISTTMVGLEPDSALALRSAFESMFAQADEWISRASAIRVTSADQKREMKFARESRLALREIRVNAEKARKRLKEDGVRRGKAIDGIANVLKALIEPIEEHLLEQETFAERADAARMSALRSAREEALRALGTDPTPYANLGETSEETWAIVLTTAQEARAARLEAERQAAARAEAERQAAARAEAERVAREQAAAEENARLRAEAKAREQVAAEERAEAKAAAAAARIEREKVEAAARKAREDADRAVAELAAERARKESELRAIAEAAAAVEAARAAAELAPDREKLIAFATTLRALTLPPLSTRAGKAAGVKVAVQILNLADWIVKTGGSL